MLEARLRECEELFQCGRFGDALAGYRSLLARRLSSHIPLRTSADLVIIERVSDLSMLFGGFRAADDLLVGMIGLCQRAKNYYAADYARVKRIHLTLARGRLREAHQLLIDLAPTIHFLDEVEISEISLKSWESSTRWSRVERMDRQVLFSSLYLGIGNLFQCNGQYADALAFLEAGQLHTIDAPDLARQTAMPLQLAASATLLEWGYLNEAEQRLSNLEGKLDELRQPGSLVRWLEQNGRLRWLQGDLGTALERFKRILDICQRHGFNRAAMASALHLAQIQLLLNQTEAAEKLLTRTYKNATGLRDKASASRATVLLSVAAARRHSLADRVAIAPSVTEMWNFSGKASPDRESHHVSEDPWDLPQANNFLAFFEDRALAFHWHLGRGNLKTAAAIITSMKRTFMLSDSRLISARLFALQGFIAYYQKRMRRAAHWLEVACSQMQLLGLRPDLWQAQRVLSWCWVRLGRPLEKLRTLSCQTDRLLERMAESLDGDLRTIYLLNKWTAEEEYIASEIDGLLHQRRQLAVSSRWRLPWSWWKFQQRLHKLLKSIDRHRNTRADGGLGARLSFRQGVSVWRWRLLRHPRNRATISFIVLPDRVVIIVLRRFSSEFGVSPMTRLELRRLIRRWHELLQLEATKNPRDKPRNLKQQQRELAKSLAEVLQIPAILDSLPSAITSLMIVPNDSLHGFPLAALAYRGGYLAEYCSVSIQFEYCPQYRLKNFRRKNSALLVEATRFQPSPSTKLAQIKRWCVKNGLSAHLLTGRSATRESLLERLKSVYFWHLECHGTFQPDRPDLSGLLLFAEENRSELLSLRILGELSLEKLEHTTLLSCWSADPFLLPGRRPISLPETLWKSGSKSILACLWLVEEKVSKAFVNRFYQYLSLTSRDEALRLTQLDCLSRKLDLSPEIDTSSPFYWAGFQLYGEPRRLILDQPLRIL